MIAFLLKRVFFSKVRAFTFEKRPFLGKKSTTNSKNAVTKMDQTNKGILYILCPGLGMFRIVDLFQVKSLTYSFFLIIFSSIILILNSVNKFAFTPVEIRF